MMMKDRPTPTDFGISEADIEQVKEQDARAQRLKGKLDFAGTLIGGSSFAWAGFLVYRCLSSMGLTVGWTAIVLYFVVVFGTFGAVGFVDVQLTRRLTHRHPKSEAVHRYQLAIDAYEDWWVRTQAEHWRRLSGRGFERELARLFRALGWETKLTPVSGDLGIDIEAKIDGARVIVQCKAHSKPVSPGVARELYGTLAACKASSAILASVSGFGRGVHEFVHGKRIKLIDLSWILEKQQSLDFERMPISIDQRGMDRWIRRVSPAPSNGRKTSPTRGRYHRTRNR
jgi:hypothetical protein